MSAIIECKNLTHYYGQRKIYENLSFEVDRKSTRLNSSHPNPSRMPSSA